MNKNAESKERPERKRTAKCSCGKLLEGEDAYFWGECDECRYKLPIASCSGGDMGAMTDLQYNGGNFHSGEW